MFTGLIEATGTLIKEAADTDGVSKRLTVQAPFCRELTLGESVSVNGVCLTVVEITDPTFAVQVSPTTLSLTTLGTISAGTLLNLERSVTPATRLGGHWVLGHVDATGEIFSIKSEGDAHHVFIQYPSQYDELVLPLGSVTVDGVSLTVVESKKREFSVTLIPHTQSMTTLGLLETGQSVNLEFDVLGKYVKHLLTREGGTSWPPKN